MVWACLLISKPVTVRAAIMAHNPKAKKRASQAFDVSPYALSVSGAVVARFIGTSGAKIDASVVRPC
jgi:hypothetical protein